MGRTPLVWRDGKRAPLALSHLLLLLVVLLLSHATPSTSQQLVSFCGGDGYDLRGLAHDYVSPANEFNPFAGFRGVVTVNPCGPITSGPCANRNASICVDDAVVAYWQPDVQPITWRQQAGGVHYSQVWNGDQCSAVYPASEFGDGSFNSAELSILCDWSAEEAYLAQVTLGQDCDFSAQLFTRLVCLPPIPRPAIPVGLPMSPFANTVDLVPGCGAGLYDLSALDASDLEFDSLGQHFWWRPCALTTPASTCGNWTTLCLGTPAFAGSDYNSPLAGGPAVAYDLFIDDLDDWELPMYTLTSFGLLIQTKNGVICPDPQYNARAQVNVYLVCDPTAPCDAVFLNLTYSSTMAGDGTNVTQCHYDLYIATAAVCPSLRLPAAAPPPWTLPYDVPYKHGQCGGAGFDVSASAIDLSVFDGETGQYWLHPCGNVTGSSYMLYDTFYDGLYSADYIIPLSTYINDAEYLSPLQAAPVWSVIEGGVQFVSTFVPDPSQDYGITSIVTTVQFLCVAEAETPWLAFVVVDAIGQNAYTAVIWTEQACGCPSYPAPPAYVNGTTWTSAVCGGGLYNLSSLQGVDLYAPIEDPEFDDDVGLFGFNQTVFIFRACGEPVSYPGCPANTSLCAISVNVSLPFAEQRLEGTQVAVSSPQGQYLITQQHSYDYRSTANALQISTHTTQSLSCSALGYFGQGELGSAPATLQVSLVCDPASVQPRFVYAYEVKGSGLLTYSLPINFTAQFDDFDWANEVECIFGFTVYTADACTPMAAPPLGTCSPSSSSSSTGASSLSSSSTGVLTVAPSCASTSKLSTGAIVGIVVGSVVGVGLLLGLVYIGFIWRTRGRYKADAPPAPSGAPTPTDSSADVSTTTHTGNVAVEMAPAPPAVVEMPPAKEMSPAPSVVVDMPPGPSAEVEMPAPSSVVETPPAPPVVADMPPPYETV